MIQHQAASSASARSHGDAMGKFVLLADLGQIAVPDDYDHATRLGAFAQLYRMNFFYYNNAITDANFPNPSRVLKPGDRLRVRAFKQVIGVTTVSKGLLAFLAREKAVHAGAQGASLVWEQKRDQLPQGFWYISFDEKKRLWKKAGYHWVPTVRADSGNGFIFDLGCFEGVWHGGSAFLCFSDIK